MPQEVGFLRVHQNHLINIKYMKEFVKSDGENLLLSDAPTDPMSVRKRAEVLQVLNDF